MSLGGIRATGKNRVQSWHQITISKNIRQLGIAPNFGKFCGTAIDKHLFYLLSFRLMFQ